jgi:hypothetical protein
VEPREAVGPSPVAKGININLGQCIRVLHFSKQYE